MQSNEKSLGFRFIVDLRNTKSTTLIEKSLRRITLFRALSKAKYLGKRRVNPAYYIIRTNHMVET